MSPDYIFSSDKSIALFSLLQYQPKLSEKINLYSRLQGLYNHNLNLEKHERSYAQLRLGLGIQNYSFGFATNLDYFGPDRIFIDNYGVFIKVDL